MNKILTIAILVFFPFVAMAQASGGQVRRPVKIQQASKPKPSQKPSSPMGKTSSETSSVKKATNSDDYSFSGREHGHEYVDLGLSVKWATCNVGANTLSDWGYYYAWGETQTKSDYSWTTYFDSKDMLGKKFYSYYYGEGSSGLKNISPTSGRDVAREKWGGKWRMPTPKELNELVTKCKWTFTSHNNVYGQRITGPSGKSIFLPCSGYYSFKKLSGQGSFGWYWSSSLSNNNEIGKAIKLSFPNNSCDNKDVLLQNDLRYCGGSVRPVFR